MRPLLCASAIAVAVMAAAAEAAEPQSRPATSRAAARKLSDEELKALLDRLQENLGAVRSIRTNFVQEKHLSLFTDVVRSEGVCIFMRPDVVRFEIRQPFQSVLIAGGGKVAKYDHLEGQWQKIKVMNQDVALMVTGQIASWLTGRFRDKSDVYEISATEADEQHTLILRPRHEEFRKHVTSIELALMKGLTGISSVTIRESGEDFTVMTFSGEQRDVDIRPELFDTSGQAPADLPKDDAAPASQEKKP